MAKAFILGKCSIDTKLELPPVPHNLLSLQGPNKARELEKKLQDPALDGSQSNSINSTGCLKAPPSAVEPSGSRASQAL